MAENGHDKWVEHAKLVLSGIKKLEARADHHDRLLQDIQIKIAVQNTKMLGVTTIVSIVFAALVSAGLRLFGR